MTPFDVLVYAPLFTLIFLRSAFLIAGLQPIFKKFQTTDLRFWIPLLEPLLICLQLIIFVSNRLSKPTHWN